MVAHETEALALGTQADVLGISRRSLYDQPVPPPPEEVALKHRIVVRSTDHPFYGSRKIPAVLTRERELINRKRVQRYMRELGIAGIAPGPNLSKRASQQRISPYLLRGVTASVPNQIWGCDITSPRQARDPGGMVRGQTIQGQTHRHARPAPLPLQATSMCACALLPLTATHCIGNGGATPKRRR